MDMCATIMRMCRHHKCGKSYWELIEDEIFDSKRIDLRFVSLLLF